MGFRAINCFLRKRPSMVIMMIIFGTIVLGKISHIESNACFSFGLISTQNNQPQYAPIFAIGQADIGRVASLYFPPNATVYIDGIVYDFYSIGELGQLGPASQWHTFPLPGEVKDVVHWVPKVQSSKTFLFPQSPTTKSTLAYVDKIYIISDHLLEDRTNNIKRMFARHNIPVDSIHWRRGRWTRAACLAKENKEEVYRTLNLQEGPLGDHTAQRYCALTMKHVEIWKEIADTNSVLSLILEDDAVFVPFFKEKFDRFVYTAIRTGALKIDPTPCTSPHVNISQKEWIEQDPAFVIGSCEYLRDSSFQSDIFNAQPILTTHKEKFSRCAHAYMLTSCSARALLRQLYAEKYTFLVIDWLQSYLGRLSPTLQTFWLDPPIVYQGNRVLDLDEIPSFRKSTP